MPEQHYRCIAPRLQRQRAVLRQRSVTMRATQADPVPVRSRAYSKRVPRTNFALRIKKCAPRIFSGIYFLSTS